MAPRRKSNPRKFVSPAPPIHHPHAAGIDVGAREVYVAVPPGTCADTVRSFQTFTEDLLALRDWLRQCGVTTIALESTGVYWIPLFQILEAAGLEVVCELGPAFADKFKTAKHFGSWLGLCPDNRITGGRIYSVKTRDVKSRVAKALRLAAQNLGRAENYFGDLYRRWKARMGAPKAITAMAHKLARVLWHLLKFKQAFDWKVFAKEEEKMKRKKLARLVSQEEEECRTHRCYCALREGRSFPIPPQGGQRDWNIIRWNR